ncbi:HNH endonuclease [Marinococcus halophilus]|uniref:HNH endonuclease n=1 Tax=Marinococcus halophilus TaxID=1371 RepID=UPI0009A561F8|nr:HNH endonuclease signature motif containing protein [Marinococcus halophilus]
MITTLKQNEPFDEEKYYRRRDIHDLYQGQQQGGISTPANYLYIFIFTGDSGEKYGYVDGWNESRTIYYYTGEGQHGNMSFTKGNKAIRDHAVNGKAIYLFQYVSSGVVKFIDEMVYIGHELKFAPDHDSRERQVIIFHLERMSYIEQEANTPEESFKNQPLEELRRIAANTQAPTEPRKATIWIHRRARAVKQYAMRRAGGYCEACNQEAPFQKENGEPFLEIHHLFRLSDGGADHPKAVAAVCPNCHRRVHYGVDAKKYNAKLSDYIAQKENP